MTIDLVDDDSMPGCRLQTIQTQIVPRVLLAFCALWLPGAHSLFAQTEPQTPVVQEVLAAVDAAARWPDGIWQGRLSFAAKDQGRRVFRFRWYQKGAARRIDFFSARRGLEARLLVRENGRALWFWNEPDQHLERLRDSRRLRPLLASGFYFEDLAGVPLEQAYQGTRRLAALASQDNPAAFWKLSLEPNATPDIQAAAYGRLVLVVRQNDATRVRQDLYNADRVLTRTLRFHYDSAVRVRSSGAVTRLAGVPTRLEMLDLSRGEISVIEFHEYDDMGEQPDALFEPEFLNR